MKPEQWQNVKEIFDSALKREPDNLAAFLDEACNGDQELRREVENLLVSSENAGDFMEQAAIGEVAEMFAGTEENNLQMDEFLNHYRILSKLGAGGMGEVHLAEDTKLNRFVALKVLAQAKSDDEDANRRLIREAQSVAALDHPNICQIYEIAETDGRSFIVMQFCEGETLAEKLEKGIPELRETLDLAIQITDALANAHSRRIIHRDIKPANIIVNRHGQAKILDFGLAKIITERRNVGSEAQTVQMLSGDNVIIGTAPYMSPEQVRGKLLDARTDIFSFGAMLYEMLSGEQVFKQESQADTIAAVLRYEPPIAKTLINVPLELQSIVRKSLAKDKKERYQTTKDLLADLKEVKQELEINNRQKQTSQPDLEEPKTQILRAAATAEDTLEFSVENQNSIAVLPFANMSADEENEYFCDGLAEELLNALSKIEDLKVAARTSAFSFKGKNANVSEIGEKLSVKNVLEGSVRRSGDKLRISVRLVNVADGYQIWSESYAPEMQDIFDVQDEITLAVVESLKLKLLIGEKESVMKRYTNNAEAYQLYLKGRYHFARRTIDDMRKAIEYFEQALEIDSEYALAFVGIADVYNSWTKSLHFSPNDSIPQAKSAAKKALEIDPALADAHASLADSLAIYDWNWTEAGKEFKRAIELNPNVANIHFIYGISYLVPMGRMDEAIAELKRAVELEPLSLILNTILAEVYLFARQNKKALDQAKIAFDLNPNFGTSRFWLGHALLANGMNEEAIELCESGLQNSPSNLVFLYIAGQSYARSGRRQKAEQIIKQIREESETQYVQPYSVARIYTELGDKDKAFVELEKAFEKRDWWLPRLKTDPLMDSLHDDPRFAEMLKRLNLPE